MNHGIIYKLNPNVTHIRGDIAYDKDDNEVVYDKDAIEAYIAANAYKSKRASEYPPITDYLDGIIKGDAAQVQSYIDACLAVKAKYPK
jgi:hypothetical protein